MLTQEQLKELLNYDPESGSWTWIESSRRGWSGREAGWIDSKGYRRIKIGGRSHICARLAFLYMTGTMPEEIDHIDRDPGNDRWSNLRASDRYGNTQNRAMRTDNLSGVIGVHWMPERRKWRVEVNNIYLGLFEDLGEASAVRDYYAIAWQGPFAQLNNT